MSFEERHPGLKGKARDTDYGDRYTPEDIDATQIDKQRLREAIERIFSISICIHGTAPCSCSEAQIYHKQNLLRELGL